MNIQRTRDRLVASLTQLNSQIQLQTILLFFKYVSPSFLSSNSTMTFAVQVHNQCAKSHSLTRCIHHHCFACHFTRNKLKMQNNFPFARWISQATCILAHKIDSASIDRSRGGPIHQLLLCVASFAAQLILSTRRSPSHTPHQHTHHLHNMRIQPDKTRKACIRVYFPFGIFGFWHRHHCRSTVVIVPRFFVLVVVVFAYRGHQPQIPFDHE